MDIAYVKKQSFILITYKPKKYKSFKFTPILVLRKVNYKYFQNRYLCNFLQCFKTKIINNFLFYFTILKKTIITKIIISIVSKTIE